MKPPFFAALLLLSALSPASAQPDSFARAEALYAKGEYFQAHQLYAQVLNGVPAAERLQACVDREVAIAEAFLGGRAERPAWAGLSSKKDPELGVSIIESLISRFPQASGIDRAEWLVAERRFDEKRWKEASDLCDRVLADFAQSPYADQAEFTRAMSWRRYPRGLEYDTTPWEKALKLFNAYAANRPQGARLEEAKAEIAAIREDLAAKDLYIARFYIRTGKPKAVEIYLQAALRDYPETKAAAEARRLLDKDSAK
ncbi:MAG: outer membrane protein assembly factor BamD [Elusimicrobia bacterium]|nr:outer membrane protein assembly factor BamD [Elusimicrobiota bacterium]